MRSLRKRFLIRAPRNKGTATGSPFSYSQPQSKSSAPAIRRDGAIALHRTAAHCYARQITQGKFRAAMRPTITPTPGTEPPRPPFRCTSPMCQRKRKIRGSQEGDKKPYWCLIPLLFSPGTPAFSAARRRRLFFFLCGRSLRDRRCLLRPLPRLADHALYVRRNLVKRNPQRH